MKRILAALVLVFVTALASWSATESKKQYVPAKILDVQEKARTRVLYYLVNTPVT